MQEPDELQGLIRFGPFEIDLQAGELRRNGRPLRLQEQPFQILALLLARPGDVVTREEIEKALWPPGTFVDFPHSIATAVRKLRLALGDDAGTARYVETVPRRGYRLLAPVERVVRRTAIPFPSSGVNPASGTAQIPPPDDRDVMLGGAALEPAKPQGQTLGQKLQGVWRRGPWTFSLGAAAALALVAAVYLGYSRVWSNTLNAPGPVRVAVLPFLNLSGDPQQEYFSDGMTDALITELGRFDSLRVISRTSAMHYKGTNETLPQIARELNVTSVVEGSVIRSEGQVRITAQLLDARRDQHTWASSYERDQRGILALQEELARDIAGEIDAKLSPSGNAPPRPSPPVSPEAFQSYLKGQYDYHKKTEAGVRAGLQDFQAAVKDDPNFAPGYAGIAACYLDMGDNILPMRDAITPAREAVTRAFEIDPEWGEAHSDKALLELSAWNWSAAEHEFRRALELNPADAVTNLEYAVFLADAGRLDEAKGRFQRALETDPLDVPLTSAAALPLYYGRQYHGAIAQYRRALAMDPRYLRSLEGIGLAFAAGGDYPRALQELERARALENTPEITGFLGYVYGRWGRRSDAVQALRELKVEGATRFVSPADIVPVYIGLDNKDEALRLLAQAYDAHSDTLNRLKVDPIFDPLRSDPRYPELERRLGLEPPPASLPPTAFPGAPGPLLPSASSPSGSSGKRL